MTILDARRLAVAATAVLAVAAGAGCATGPDGPSTDQIIEMGNAALDAVRLPTGWSLEGSSAKRYRDGLQWYRSYHSRLSPETAQNHVGDFLVEAGFAASDDCNAGTSKCTVYKKDRFVISPLRAGVLDCPPGVEHCAFVSVDMDYR